MDPDCHGKVNLEKESKIEGGQSGSSVLLAMGLDRTLNLTWSGIAATLFVELCSGGAIYTALEARLLCV